VLLQYLYLLITYFLSNISVRYYENPTLLSRVIAENIGDVFETQCRSTVSILLPSPFFLKFLHLLFFSRSFRPKVQLGSRERCKLPQRSPGRPPKHLLKYFETRRRSGCNDFGSFCTDQNIHRNQDRSYWLLPPYTSYDYFSSDLC